MATWGEAIQQILAKLPSVLSADRLKVALVDSAGADVTSATPSSLGSWRKVVTVAGTDEAIGATACKSVLIQAETDNTGIICVGASGVDAAQATRTGVALSAGESVALDIDSLADVFIDSTVSGDGVTYLYTV